MENRNDQSLIDLQKSNFTTNISKFTFIPTYYKVYQQKLVALDWAPLNHPQVLVQHSWEFKVQSYCPFAHQEEVGRN